MKILVSFKEVTGEDSRGYSIVEANSDDITFPVDSNLEWKDTDNTSVAPDYYWYDPITNSCRKEQIYINPEELLGELAVDSEGNKTEQYVWDWNTDAWTKVSI